MSVADKLTQIAENEEKVFDAGKRSLLKASRYMNGTKSGEVVSVNDVSPVEHDVEVTLSGESVTDFSQVNVKQYGKNLCKVSGKSKTSGGITFTNNGDGTVTVNGTAAAEVYYDVLTSTNFPPVLPIGTALYISGCPSTGSSNTYYINLPWVGWYDYGKGVSAKITSQSIQTNWRQCIRIHVKSGAVCENVVFKPQVELSGKTEFEQYIEPTTYTASADGTVTGVKSLSPVMTLVSDTDGVTVDCSYLRDIDTYIDALTGGA